MTMSNLTPDDRKHLIWPTLLREDGIRIEILCPHGIGHPSKLLTNPDEWKPWMHAHGCDGCCGQPQFSMTEQLYKGKK